MKADFIRCTCTRMNDPWRRFCGGCARKLGPSCTCGFVNAKSDVFCGGCGTSVASVAAVSHARRTEEPSTMPIEIIDVVS